MFHSWLSSKQDGVLLEICNWNKENSVWSLVATTSLDLAEISLPRCQTVLDTSVTTFVPSPSIVTEDDWCVHYPDQVHSLKTCLPSLLVLVVSQVTSNTSSFLLSSGVNADPTLRLIFVCKISPVVGTILTLKLQK
jgi:hypothetical protein